ncbi:MAG: carbohydrate ABC transporter permease [Anaerolineales bacterium]|jgi:ABC-type glycerol-3-phosphate transport system permease component
MVNETAQSRSTVKLRPRRRIDFGRTLTYVVLTLGAVVAIVPFLWMISASLMNLTEATGRAVLPRVAQWENYAEAWTDADIGEFFINSVIIAVITIAGQLVFSTLAAYAFARIKFPAKGFIFTLLLSTLMIPEAVVWIPNFITVTWLGRVGPIPWINNWPALTIPFMASAFSIFLLRQFFIQVPSELWDSAQIDGAGHVRFLTQIAIPLARPAILTVSLFTFIGSWNALAWPILVTSDPEWRPISYGLSRFVQEAGVLVHLQMAGSVITILPILIMYLMIQRRFTEGIATTGLKG